MQGPGQIAQAPQAVAQCCGVGGLWLIQRPDHAIEGAPAAQALPLAEQGWRLYAATMEQHGVLPMQELSGGQSGGDGFDLLGFADDQEQADFEAPEGAVVFIKIHLSHANLMGARGFRTLRTRSLGHIIRSLCAMHRVSQTAPQKAVGSQAYQRDKSERWYRQQPSVLSVTARTHS